MNRWTFFLLLWALSFLPEGLTAQITLAEQPRSTDVAIRALWQNRPFPVTELAPLNAERLRAEDRQFPGDRFAAPVSVDLSLENSGQWIELPGGDRLWRLHVRVPEAEGLALLYDRFFLPRGSRLHVYRPDRRQIIGAYTWQNNPLTGRFLTGFVQGEDIIVEYFEPAAVRGRGQLHIFRVDQVYQEGLFGRSALRSAQNNELGFGASLACHDNINCTEGDDWQTEKRGVVRILVVVAEGSGFCTGNLINNTRADGRPLVLSAFHCQDGFTPLFDLYRFDFGYEGSDCVSPGLEPSRESILGCTRLAGRQENDFILFELFNSVPQSFEPYFLGWDRQNTGPDSATFIHHPRGDIKKIAFDHDPIRIFNGRINWNNDITTPPNHHFIAHYDLGTFEIGSSGGAMLNPQGRIVGQLHGGIADCDSVTAYFGRLSLSWEGGGTPDTRLRDWLDPDGTNALFIDGMEGGATTGMEVGGRVQTEAGTPLSGVQVNILGDAGTALSTATDAQGRYRFTGLPQGDNYELDFSKNDDALNGVSTLDLIQVQRHILNLVPLASPYTMLAADVNNSGSITTLDLIIIRRVILGISPDFSPLPSWVLVPAGDSFIDPENPLGGLSPDAYRLNNLQSSILDFDVVGYKPGDVSGDAAVN